MSDPSNKPPRKKLGLKAPAEPVASDKPEARKKPVRWSPLQRDRARSTTEAPPPASAKKTKTNKANKPARPGKTDQPARGAAEGRRRPPQDGPARTPGQAQANRQAPAGEQRPRPAKPEGERRRPVKAEPVRLAFFAPCPRGLEALLGKELAHLGAVDILPASGGVGFAGDMQLAWRVNLWSRLAVRVLWQVGRGAYQSEEDLYVAALALPWPDLFAVDKTIAVRTVGHACALKSLNFVTLRIKDAVCDRFRQETEHRPSVETRTPDVPVLAYLDKERYTFYIDLSGDPLNRRGYRVEPAPAPLNENLAAGMLMLAGWEPEMPLLDPMMGGGTILLEAAMISLNMAPGLNRHFAFENLYGFDKVEWTRLRKDAQAEQAEPRQLPIYGADIDPAMVRAAGLNLKAAGLLDCVTLREGDVLEIPAPGRVGMIVSNPPYGVRLTVGQGASAPRPSREEIQPADFAVFYSALGDALKQRFAGWSAHFLSADPELPKEIGLKAAKRTPLYNGPLDCRLYEYRMVAGTMRDKPAMPD